jgi:pimeloyl-ACP methyl ester carboxylesterase
VWEETRAALGTAVRSIAYDRRAYGDSGAPEPYGATSVEEQAEDATLLLERLGAAPAFVVGHSFGALVALDLLRRRPDLVSGAVAIEPPLLWLVEGGSEVFGALREAVADGARDAGPPGAVDAYLATMAGDGWHARLGPERTAAARERVQAFAADLAGTANWTVTRRELRAIEAPVTVVSGTRSPAPYREAARALADLLPEARLDEPDCGWLTPVEAADQLARRVASGASA